MVPPMAANPPSTNQTVHTTPSHLLPLWQQKIPSHATLILCFVLFSYPLAPAKFNLITAMTTLFHMMLKDKPSLVLRTPSNNKQIILMSASVPKGETEFKKYFKVSTTCIEHKNQTQVCIGCHVLCNWSLSNIKFCSPEGNLLVWLKKESSLNLIIWASNVPLPLDILPKSLPL